MSANTAPMEPRHFMEGAIFAVKATISGPTRQPALHTAQVEAPWRKTPAHVGNWIPKLCPRSILVAVLSVVPK